MTGATVIPFPVWLVERRGEVVCGPAAEVVVLPVIRVERCRDHIGDPNEKMPPAPRRKRRAKR